MKPRKSMRTHSFLSSVIGSDGGNRVFLSSISGMAKLIFVLTFIASLWLMLDNFGVFHFMILMSLGISLVITFIFELVYQLFRNKSNLG